MKNFIWSVCSGPDAIAHINELKVSEPLSIPGNTTVTLDSNVFADITTPLKVTTPHYSHFKNFQNITVNSFIRSL